MEFSVICPQCSGEAIADETMIGAEASCPHCASTFSLPGNQGLKDALSSELAAVAAREKQLANQTTALQEKQNTLEQVQLDLEKRKREVSESENAANILSKDLDALRSSLDDRTQTLNKRQVSLDKLAQMLSAKDLRLKERQQQLVLAAV